MIPPLIKIIKRVDDAEEILYNMDDVNASATLMEIAQTAYKTVKSFPLPLELINHEKRGIQLNSEKPLPVSPIYPMDGQDGQQVSGILDEERRSCEEGNDGKA